ncbi:hypothetical protein CPB83DRAFT_845037 [Crepidotus variabilis]|uniref:Uncharacterized protein n=1 Tax=Crepidotus variabilis TaxID=179855 RepID=A0A9P6JW22_9AGAR|nr:hypothetical protein CPB83DRAFT_845037 [Crepidotus variabilis]
MSGSSLGPDRVRRQRTSSTLYAKAATNIPAYTRSGFQNHPLSAGGYTRSGSMPNFRKPTRAPRFKGKEAK